jgi:hypothetical protein
MALGTAFAGVSAIALKTADDMSQVWESAMKVGTSTEFLSGMRYTAGQAGIELDKLTGAFTKLNMATAKGNPAFEQMGISLKTAEGVAKTSDQLFLDVAERFAQMEDGAKKTSLAVGIFGKSGADLIPLLNQGADSLKAQNQQAKELGLTFDDLAGAKADALADTFGTLKASLSGMFLQAGASAQEDLIPVFEELIDLTKGWGPIIASVSKGIATSFRWILASANALAGAVVDIFHAITFVADDFLQKLLKDVNKLLEYFGKTPIKIDFVTNARDALKESSDALYGKASNLLNPTAITDDGRGLGAGGVVTDGGKKTKAKKVKDDSLQIAIDAENKANEARVQAIKKEQEQLKAQEAYKSQLYVDGLAYRAQAQADASIQADMQREAELAKIRLDFEQKRMQAEEMGLSSIALLEQQKNAELAVENQYADAKKALHEQELARIHAEREARFDLAQSAFTVARSFFPKMKSLMVAEALLSGYRAVMNAMATQPFLPVGLAAAAVATAQTTATINSMRSTRMATGGMIEGVNSLVLANENGQESIINARGTRALGREGVNALNEGRFSDLVNKLSGLGGVKSGGINISISGGVVDKRFVERELIPLINNSMRRI